MASETPRFSVGDFVASLNQTLEYAYPVVEIEGEVASFKVNQSKYVFFDLKDDGASVSCFMMLFQMRTPIEDGMKIIVTATPKLTPWGKFSLTVKNIRPVGEGSIKKSFELLRAKLDKEGLFALERKRTLPELPAHVGVISSTQAAGYSDFVRIINERWGGVLVDVAHVQVQGEAAANQIIQAIKYFNQQEDLPEVLVIIRGGGSADDLAVFNDEPLVRAIAASRIPTLVGVGHETDESLADLAADVRAATPSHAAQILVPDKREIIDRSRRQVDHAASLFLGSLDRYIFETKSNIERAFGIIQEKLEECYNHLAVLRLAVSQVNPENVLKRGYALLRGEQKVGSTLEIETYSAILGAEVKNVRQK